MTHTPLFLQAENEKLLKASKAMVDEKELLEHTALKVKSDLEGMKARYQDTVSAMTALIANPDPLSLMDGGPEVEGGPADPSNAQLELTQASVAQLKKMNQLASAQEEKTDAKLKAKLEELERTKCELQQRIRYMTANVYYSYKFKCGQ